MQTFAAKPAGDKSLLIFELGRLIWSDGKNGASVASSPRGGAAMSPSRVSDELEYLQS